MADAIQGHCREPGCAAGQGGSCIENFDLEECANFIIGEPSEDVELEAPPQTESEEAYEIVPTRVSVGFSQTEADAFLRETGGPIRTVAIVGDPDSGKTTLIASLYELLRAARLNFGFAGSDTVRGFEHRCYLSRTASGRRKGVTMRTRLLDGLAFLHLRVLGDQAEPLELILADRPGEDFEGMLTRPDEVVNLAELQTFGVVAFLIDGSKLADPAQRHAHTARIRRMILAMARSGMLQSSRRYQLILTKSDELDASEQKDAGRDVFRRFTDDLGSRFPDASFDVHEVAARPDEAGGVPFGFGLEAMATQWLARSSPPTSHSLSRVMPTGSVFDRMSVRFVGRGV